MQSPITDLARSLGFSEEVIKQAIKRGTRKYGGLESPEKLVEFIKEGGIRGSVGTERQTGLTQTGGLDALTAQARKGTGESVPMDCSEGSATTTNAGNTASWEKRLRELEDERKCKVCLDDASANMLFLPCGHICTCLGCARALRKCPVCRKKIEKIITTYRS